MDLWVRKILWRRAWQPTLVLLPGKSPWNETKYYIYHYRAKSTFPEISAISLIHVLLSFELFTRSTLCDPMDCSPQGSSVHGDSLSKNTRVGCHALLQRIFPTQGSNPGLRHYRQISYCLSHQGSPRILEWVAYPFSRRFSQPRNRTGVKHYVMTTQKAKNVN